MYACVILHYKKAFKSIMKIKTLKKHIFIILLIIIAYNLSFITYSDDGMTEEEKLRILTSQNNIDKINESKKKVENTIKNLNLLKNNTQKYIEELDKNLELLINELNKTLVDIDNKQIEINITNDEIDKAKIKEEKQYNDMKLRIKFFYEKGETSLLENILSGDNLEDILTKAEYIQSITDYDRKKLNELVEIKNSIILFENQLEREKSELLLLKETEIAQKESIEKLIEEKTKELEDTKSRINTSQAELKKLREEEKKLEAEIAAIEKAILARSNSKRILSGGLIWPCPASKRITSGFGNRKSPTKGASTYHEGIDIGAPTGSTVLAAAAGEVVISKYSYSAGNYIMINHGSGIFTVYMHLSIRSVDVGQELSQGQKIGEVGSTGYSTGPHLHFGIRKNGNYVNPLTFVG